jgi:hypothetical protein
MANKEYKDLLKNLSMEQRLEVERLGQKYILPYWALKNEIIVDGIKFTFKNHEYLIDIYFDMSPKKVFKKGAQLGFSTYEMLSAIFGCKNIYPKGVLYMFPTKDDVTDFSDTRFGRVLDDNKGSVGQWVKDTDRSNLKKVGQSFLYLRGTRTRTALKSIPVDKLIYDEYDEMRPGKGSTSSDKAVKFDPIALARERISHSEYKHVDILGTPLLPDYGVEAEFKKSSQKHWYIYCEACGEHTCMELEFPKCLKMDKGRVIRACKKCGGEINPSNGQWIEHYKNREMTGYYISQLCSHYIEPREILETFNNLDDLSVLERQEFYNSKLGMGYIEIQDRLSKQQILALCDPYMMDGADNEGTAFMGVDQGKHLHYMIGKKNPDDKTIRVIHMGVMKEWEDLYRLMDVFSVWRCVCDGQPETRNARKFADAFPGNVYLHRYDYHLKGATKWDYNNFEVNTNRTESLDDSHDAISQQRLLLPRQSSETEAFAIHCTNIVKKRDEDPETGSKSHEYVKLSGPDHYRHTFNYLMIAGKEAPSSFDQGPAIEGFRQRQFVPSSQEEAGALCNTYH